MNIIPLLVMLLLLAGIVFLQIFLSKRASRWPGLILPAISFLYSLLMLLNLVNNDNILAAMLTTLLVGNIPTVVLLGIYFACGEKRKVRLQLEKMNVQDLE